MQRSRNTFSAQWKDCNPKRGICSHGLNTLFCLLLCYIVPELCTATSTLKVGIYFTSSCNVTFVQNINNTISTVMTSVRNKIDHSVAVLSPKPYFFCSEQEVFTHVGNNFNKTDELVIGIASYRLHNALRIFSDVYDFPYVASDSYMIGSSGKTFSMSSSFLQTGEVMVHVLDFFQWEGAAVVASNTRYWQDLATQIFIQLNVNHFNTRKKYTIETEGIIESVIKAITDSEKAVILCLHAQDQASFLSASAQAGVLTKHAYFLFSPSPPHGDTPLAPVYLSPTLTDFNLSLQDPGVLESVFVVGAELPLSAPSLPSLDAPDYSAVQGAAVSSLLLVCEALLAYLDAGGQHVSPSHVLQHMVNLSFQVDGRQMTIDGDGAILYNYYVYDFEVTNATFTPRIALSATKSHSWSVRLLDAIQWPRGIPLGADQCFKQGISCKFVAAGVDTVYIIIIFVAGVGIIILVVVVVIVFRRYWTRKELTKGPHKLLLQPSDLTFLLKKDKGKGSRMMKSTLFDKPDLVKASEPNRSTISINELSDFTETARYNGDLVHVKELLIKGFEIKSKIMTHIRSLRDLRHENLNPCVGLLVDPLKPAIVMEYCSRGSLEDVINNEDIKLDWDFKLSLLTDLVRGLRYIHSSPIRCHGNLKSRNCVIDSRWQLRITDYGMSGFLLPLKQNRTNLESRDLLWTAPECLREVSLMTRGSEKADIFSLGIIMQEVALRSTPYSSTGLAPDTIIAKVKKPPPLIRPSVSPQAAPPQYIQIMKQAWSEMPEMRPGIEDVYDQFKKITGGKKANIVDTMFHMLEKYSNDLEEIVAERTTQLEEEKKKTDQLLFRMLPSTVAESLKIGRPVKAESFEEATIYFSDIVGFTTISAMSTPMQVVDLLNDLYTMFDATIDNYDVYKVETIGDAYMVSSGLPIRNGNRHAGEISTMALDLLSQCGKFTIRHMPDVPMRLRIGLHSGPCVAGVVGLTMPRYCLFGDTVNTASRMESTGAPFRIHVSRQCKDVLDALGGYLLDYRGETELKGKGKAPTYWLVGKEGFTKELPQPPEQGEGNHGLDSVMTGSKHPDKSESLSDTKAPDNEPNTVKKVSEEGVGRDPPSAKPGAQYDENLNKTLSLSGSVDEPDPLPSGKISLDSLPEGQGGIMETNESEVSVRTNVSVVSASDISFHDEKGTKETTKEVPHILAPVSEV